MSAIRWRDIVITIATVVTVALAWEVIVRLFNVPLFLVPPPSRIAEEMAQRPELYATHTWVTLVETVLGFLLATVFGIVVGILIVYSRWLQSVLYPVVVVLQIVPKIAVAPLLLIWLGYGLQSKLMVALLVAFFPIVVTTVTGLRAVEPDLLDLVRVLKGGRWQEFAKVRFPYALPFIFSGLKVAITLAVIGAIIGEFVGSNSGLGYLVIAANAELRTPMSFAALLLLSALGLGLFGLIVAIERLVIPWGVTEEEPLPVTGA